MNTKAQYGNLDRFRLAAALLVVAIHTSPLASISDNADFFFTRVLARVAVPFFFMVTGHFVLSELFPLRPSSADAGAAAHRCNAKISAYLLKLCLLYVTTILLYMPLGIYAGHFEGITLGTALRMLLFDGTFYHLWYFPACILGVLLVWGLSCFLSLKMVTAVSAFLYLMGLFGDSYYGLAEKISILKQIYKSMFHLFSYTRNGLFLAPLFLVLGIWAGRTNTWTSCDSEETTSIKKQSKEFFLRNLFCLAGTFAAMTAEAFTLHYWDLQRHDSMYLFLVPVMFFLYRCLTCVPRTSRKSLRAVSTWIYVLHPALIVVVRGMAKILRLNKLLVDNSLIHYLAVVGLSLTVSIGITYFRNRFLCNLRLRPGYTSSSTNRAWIELDMAALKNNVTFLQSRLPQGCHLMPAVKADAYGHGAAPIAKALNRMGVKNFCVACVAEGIELRKVGIRGEILILGFTHPSQFPLLRRYRLTQTVLDYSYGKLLEKSKLKLHVHIAVDTGMHRLGIPCENLEEIASVYHIKNLSVDGIFTHLSACDSVSPECTAFTEAQILSFYQVTESLNAQGCPCHNLHLLSSYGILNYPEAAADCVRPGIALYGVLSTADNTMPEAAHCLQPVLSLKARVASVRTLQPGDSAGYGLDFTARSLTKIAVLSIGYADGLPRELSEGKGTVLIHGQSAPIIGRICMDQTLVDVTDIQEVCQNDIAVLIGHSGKQEIKATDLAEKCNTITNEILSRLDSRLGRVSIS